jgi:beta-alanine--pyruvate transaminase
MPPRDFPLEPFWMPFTANRQFKAAPRILVSAKDMHYTAEDGRKILDGTAGLWCVNAGHCRPRIVQAIQRQAETLDYSPLFQMGHPGEFRAAGLIADLAPDGLDRVFFANSGSEAVDTALKIALAYHRARGEGQRNVLIGRERGYHGVGFGGISVGGIPANRKAFGSLLPRVDHLPHTHNLQRNAFSRGQPEWGAHLADDLESRIIALHDASNIAAVIVEPVAGSTGVLVPPKGYLERLRAICDKYGLLLIFDEVITGFGRTGRAFAAETFGVVPDLITFAKGVTNATVPLATAAAEATLALYHEEKLFDRARSVAPRFEEAVHGLKDLPHVIDVRNFGLMAGIELEPAPGKPGTRGFQTFLRCFEKGILARVAGDVIAFSPPLIISEGQIDELVGTLGAALREI